MKCYIVKDLLPNYIDNLTDKDIKIEIDTHLKECSKCRRVYEHMLSSAKRETPPDNTEIDFLKKLKAIIRRKYIAVIFLTCAAWTCFMIFARNYKIPVSYDENHMYTETYQAAEITNPYGHVQWEDADLLDFETTKAVISKGDKLINLIRLVREASADESIDSYGRTIDRNGQKVRVIYYCYTTTLWNQWFPRRNEELSTQVSTGDLYGDCLYHENYEPQMREIYYLPMKHMGRLEKCSDDELDAQREKAVLVWNGTI